jgi:transcription antitermination protein NusB
LKSRQDPRHKKRVNRFQKLFAYSFENSSVQNEEVAQIVAKLGKIDKAIQEVAPEWPIDRLNKTDLAILRLAIWELLIERKTPPKVIIDEAVELGKEYGSDNTAKFVNGVLGTLLEKRGKAKK